MSKASLEELLVAAGRLSTDEQRLLFKELVKKLMDDQLGEGARGRPEFDKAVEYFNKALAIFEGFPLEGDPVERYWIAAALYRAAIDYFDEALAGAPTCAPEREVVSEGAIGDQPAVDTSADLDPVEKTRGSMSGLDRETIIWLAEDEELCGY